MNTASSGAPSRAPSGSTGVTGHDQKALPPDSSTTEVRKTLASPPSLARRRLEIGGYDGPEPTRFGDWEQRGRCSDF